MSDRKGERASLATDFISVEDGHPYYCEATVTSAVGSARGPGHPPVTTNIGGILTISAGKISLRLVRFDERFEVQEDDRIEARSEANWVASLFDIVPMGMGQWGLGKKAAYNVNVLVNTAVLGWDAWSIDDRVRLTRFRLASADNILRHLPTYDRLVNNPFAAPVALDEPVSGGRVRILYTAFFDMNKNPINVWPVIEMDFDEGLTLGVLRARTHAFVSFLSAAASKSLAVREQVVSRLSSTELLEHIEPGTRRAEYSMYIYGKDESASMHSADRLGAGSFVLLFDDNERSAFIKCLQSWFDRYSIWEHATSAMMDAFALQGMTGSERLLNATKWIEQTPGAESQRAMSEEDIKEISNVMSRRADELGHGGIYDRLSNCLSMVAAEKRSQRFSRLTRELKAFYGESIVGDDLAEWVTEAFHRRGKAAHCPIIYTSAAERERVYMAIHAAECFAYLMLLRELPMSNEGKTRVAEAPLVRFYTRNIKGRSPGDPAG